MYYTIIKAHDKVIIRLNESDDTLSEMDDNLSA